VGLCWTKQKDPDQALLDLISGRFATLSRTGAGRSRLSLELEKWLALNYWTPTHFSKMAQLSSPSCQELMPRQMTRIVSGSLVDLMPVHFKAFARIEALVRKAWTTDFNPRSEEDLLARFASSICCDDSALRASWWFGLYCNEPWALNTIREDSSQPGLEMAMAGKLLPAVLRDSVTKKGLDLVDFLRSAETRLPSMKQLSSETFADWVLENKRLDGDAVRLALPFVLMLLTELGMECKALSEFSLASQG
jgi:hypothetical protein